jgi:hypothetical protein
MLSKVPSKLDLLLAVATMAALMGFIERGHSIVIEPPDQIALAAPATPCVEIVHARGDMTPTVFPEDLFASGFFGPPPIAAERRSCEPY